MSTKIYNSFHAADQNLEDTFRAITAQRSAILAQHHNLLCNYLAETCADRLDRAALLPCDDLAPLENPDKMPLHYAWSDLRDRVAQIEQSRSSDPEIDFSLSVTLFPNPRGTLGLMFSDKESLRDMILSLPGFQSHDYWNSTDRPSDLTAEAWEQRRGDWDEAFEADSRPSHAGLTITLTTERPHQPKAEDVALRIGSPEDRAHRLAIEMFRNSFIKSQVETSADTPTNHIVAAIYKANEEVRSGRGADTIKDMAREIAPRLIARPTLKDLRGW
jgi:hypothetical protein